MRRLFVSLLFASLVPVAGCMSPAEVDGVEQPIINGDTVPDDGFPSVGMVLMIAKAGQSQTGPFVRQPLAICTGTLIAPDAVLLAAHCVDKQIITASLQASNIFVDGDVEQKFTFEHQITSFIVATPQGNTFNEKATLLPVKSIDQFKTPVDQSKLFPIPGQMDDIAILHLASPVKGHPVQKLATKADVDKLAMGSTHAIAGYGQSTNDDVKIPGTDMTVPPAVTAGVLRSGVSKLDQVGDHEIVAGNMDPQQACHGDSGGPIFIDETTGLQLGIASRINALPIGGQPKCEPGLAYTRVDVYADWISQHVPNVGQPTANCTVGDTDPSCPPDGSGVGGSGGSGGSGGAGGGTGGNASPDMGTGGGGKDKGCGCDVGGASTGANAGIWIVMLAGAALLLRRRRA
jgi:MYXO-CTERM domain-containing protein